MEKSNLVLTALLRCPDSGLPLREAVGEELAALRALGHPCREGALVREDGRRAYPVVDGFPVMLSVESVELG